MLKPVVETKIMTIGENNGFEISYNNGKPAEIFEDSGKLEEAFKNKPADYDGTEIKAIKLIDLKPVKMAGLASLEVKSPDGGAAGLKLEAPKQLDGGYASPEVRLPKQDELNAINKLEPAKIPAPIIVTKPSGAVHNVIDYKDVQLFRGRPVGEPINIAAQDVTIVRVYILRKIQGRA